MLTDSELSTLSRFTSALVPSVWASVETSTDEADGQPFSSITITPAWASDPVSILKGADGLVFVDHLGHEHAKPTLAEALVPWAELVGALEARRVVVDLAA